MGPERIIDLRAYIEERSIPVPENGCWLWLLALDRGGYGSTALRNSYHGAHKISYHAFHGPIPEGKFVCHKCDVRCCVNPDHLYAGDAYENMRDMSVRGRYAKAKPAIQGESHVQAKLTMRDVLAIRASNESQRTLSKRYGINQATVSRLRRGKYWKWLSLSETA
jgi:hypothetical protein